MLVWDVLAVCPLKKGAESQLDGPVSLFPAFLVVLRAMPTIVCLRQVRQEVTYRMIGLIVLHIAGVLQDKDEEQRRARMQVGLRPS